MSLLIKGMEMPTSCEWCRFISGSLEWYCEAGQFQIYDYKTIHKDCPLSKILTPHGRLIDADALLKTIEANDYMLRSDLNTFDRGMFTIGIQQAIDEAPTIIEAEE